MEQGPERKRRVRPPRKVIFDGVFSLGRLGLFAGPAGAEALDPAPVGGESGGTGLGRAGVMTVQRTLKKTNCSLIGRSIGGSRPGAAPHS